MTGIPIRDPAGPSNISRHSYVAVELQMANHLLGIDGVVKMLLGSLL